MGQWSCWYSVETVGKDVKNSPPSRDTRIDLNGWKAELCLFRCNNTNHCGLFCNDKTKTIPKNALHVGLPGLHCKHTVDAISSDSQEQNYCRLGPLSLEPERLLETGKFNGATGSNWKRGNSMEKEQRGWKRQNCLHTQRILALPIFSCD